MIALIDADSLIYSTSYKRTPDEAVLNLSDRIDDICEKLEVNEYAIFLTIGKTFRHDINSYKSNRPTDRKLPVFYYIKEILRQDANYTIGVEADDLVTYWAYKSSNHIACSPDKDVINTNLKCYNYNKNEFINNTDEEISYNFWKQMLTGDSSDGILGLPGVGPKTSDKWFQKVLLNLKTGKDSVTIEQLVLSKYLEHLGFSNGMKKFYENFKQLYILRNEEDFKNNGIEAPKQFKTVKRNEI